MYWPSYPSKHLHSDLHIIFKHSYVQVMKYTIKLIPLYKDDTDLKNALLLYLKIRNNNQSNNDTTISKTECNPVRRVLIT